MIFDAAAAGIILGLLLGGKLRNLLEMKIRWIGLLLVSILFEYLPKAPYAGTFIASHGGVTAAYLIAFIRYGLLFAFVILNIKNIPVLMIGAGGMLNFAVTAANGGAMPVVSAAIADAPSGSATKLLEQGLILNYRIAGAGTNLSFLCDRIPVRLQYIYYVSIGDLLIALGIFLFVLYFMKPRLLQSVFHKPMHTKV